MEIDCLICGRFELCNSIHASCAHNSTNNYNERDNDSEKWSKTFCKLLNVNMSIVPDIEGIIQYSYYCQSCIPDLQLMYETFCEIEKLKENLCLKRNECLEKLKTSSSVKLKNEECKSFIDDIVTVKIDVRQLDLPSQNQCLSRDKLVQCLQADLPKSEEPLFEKSFRKEQQIWDSPNDDIADICVGSGSYAHTNITDAGFENLFKPPENTCLANKDHCISIDQNFSSLTMKTCEKTSKAQEADLGPELGSSKRIPKPKRFQKEEKLKREVQVLPDKPVVCTQRESDVRWDPNLDEVYFVESENSADEFNNCDPDYNFEEEIYKKAPHKAKNEKFGSRRRTRASRDSVPKRFQKHQSKQNKDEGIQLKDENSTGRRLTSVMTSNKSESDSCSDILYDSDSNVYKDPDYDIEEDMPTATKRKRRRKILVTEEFLPTILSTQTVVKNITLLERKYKALIELYGVKKAMIPVIKLPDEDTESESEESRLFVSACPVLDCKTKFYRKYTLVEHIKVVHKGIKHPYQCKSCGRKYTSRADYKDHLNVHSNTLPYPCQKCDLRFPTRKKLHDHNLFKHSPAKFQCEHCGKFFMTNRIYQVHLTVHSQERPFVCEVCGKSFKLEYLLRNHRTIHPELNLKQFKCEFCCKVFGQPFFLKKHLLVHTGELPFLCDKCDYRAPYKSLLRSHMVVHNEGKQFECDVCHARYKAAAVLKRHKKFECGKDKDSKDFLCTTCGKGFRTRQRLLVHAKVHTIVGKPFLCYLCGSSFTMKRNLKRHIDSSHKEKGTSAEILPATTTVVEIPSTITNNVANSCKLISNSSEEYSVPISAPVPLLPELTLPHTVSQILDEPCHNSSEVFNPWHF